MSPLRFNSHVIFARYCGIRKKIGNDSISSLISCHFSSKCESSIKYSNNTEKSFLCGKRSILYSSSSPYSKDNGSKELQGYSSPESVYGGEAYWHEIYKGVLTTQLKLLKVFSLSTSVIGLSVQPILYEKIGGANLAVLVGFSTFVGFFTFVTPAIIHWMSKKYVTKLEYDPKTDVYAASTLSFFLKEKKIHFKIEDVVRPDIPGPLTSFLVGKKPLFVDPSLFDDISHYSRIMGYDKPFDISLSDDEKDLMDEDR